MRRMWDGRQIPKKSRPLLEPLTTSPQPPLVSSGSRRLEESLIQLDLEVALT